jgi:Asp-tRNA(Asn)/Glu-tRNA(Gln) amidotransferase A subunit family amidase
LVNLVSLSVFVSAAARAITAALIVFLGALAPAHAWGSEDHRIVAGVAEQYLEPATAHQVRELLAIENATTLAQVSTWADDTGIDIAVTASGFDPTCRIDDDKALATNYWRQARMPFNVTGQPALVIPAGFTKGGLPLSLQLIGHPFAEATVYRAAAAYEAATEWIKRHPPGLAE